MFKSREATSFQGAEIRRNTACFQVPSLLQSRDFLTRAPHLSQAENKNVEIRFCRSRVERGFWMTNLRVI
jgi:hypothetical protein